MEELNSWWARGGGGFAWFRLVKCRKVHKETLVLFPSVSQRLNKVQFCQINQKTLTEKVQQLPVELQMCRCDAGWTRPVRPRLQSLPCIPVRARLWAVGVFFVCVSCVCHLNEDALKLLTVWETDRSREGCRRRWRKSRHLCRKWDWREEGNNSSASDEKD